MVSGARLYRENVTFPDIDAPSNFEDSAIYQEQVAEREAEEAKQKEIEAGGAEVAGGFPVGGSISGDAPNGMSSVPGGRSGGMSGGIPAGMMGQLPEGVDLSKLAAMFGAGRGGFSSSNDDVEDAAKREEEAAEYTKSIQERLEHDGKIALIEPFFTRTVMEMQRELLSAVSTKTAELQARIAARQNEITRRQEEIEFLQKSNSADLVDEDSSNEFENDSFEEVERLREEIKTLRGDSDADPLERISYLEQIDWTKFVSGNEVTKEALDFLLEDSDQIFNEIFPNSHSLDVSANAASVDALVEREAEKPDYELLKRENDAQYGAFKQLFDAWDSDNDGKLKPTEFVIGFFTDRKSFQDSETDDDIDKLFDEYCAGDDSSDKNEASLEAVQNVVDKILRERGEIARRSRRGGGSMSRMLGANGGVPGMPGGSGMRFGEGSRPGGSQGQENNERPVGVPNAEVGRDENPEEAEKRPDNLEDGRMPKPTPPVLEPIKSLAEASSLRQAIALFAMQMDFNGDEFLQKSEFVKGYNEVKEVAGKMFASASSGSGGAGGDGAGRMMGPPPM